MSALHKIKSPISRSALVGPLLAGLLSLVIIWIVVSEVRLAGVFSVLAIIAVGFYFLGHFEKAYFPFMFVIVLPVALFITAIPDLRAFELVIPGLLILLIVRQAVLRSGKRETRIVPLPMIAFFAMGLASYLRHPSLPAQVFAAAAEFGNFRVYWTFFLGLMTYILAFRLFQEDKNRKIIMLVKLLTVVSVSGLLIQFTASHLNLRVPVDDIFIDWGPFGEAEGIGTTIFRGWAIGWFGLFLFLILISIPDHPKNQILRLSFFLLSLVGIILSGARSILLAASGGAILLCLLRKKYLRAIFPLSAVAAVLSVAYAYPGIIDRLPEGAHRVFTIFPVPDASHPDAVGSALLRVTWWREAMEIISRHPLLGIGFERIGIEARYIDYAAYAVRIGAAHSAYIATGVMLGLPGLAVLIWIFGLHLKRGIILSRQSSETVEKNLNIWLTLMIVAFNIIFFFAGSPQRLYTYFFYAGLINLNWHLRSGSGDDPSPPGPAKPRNNLSESTPREKAKASSGNVPEGS